MCVRCHHHKPNKHFFVKSKRRKCCKKCRQDRKSCHSSYHQPHKTIRRVFYTVRRGIASAKISDCINGKLDTQCFVDESFVHQSCFQQQLKCKHCNVLLKGRGSRTLTLDRRSFEVGHTKLNSFVVCWSCAQLRGEDYDLEEFQEFVNRKTLNASKPPPNTTAPVPAKRD
mmetsp:Transcript_15478/g.21765  ORF Transcript_15478/g.21765 Transcript_15478/m.21765 type:complete len:170 (-) Transcript_15478:149-658(-)